MTVGEMLRRISSREITEWIEYQKILAEERAKEEARQ